MYVVFCSILFWLDARCACASVERQLYAISLLRLYVWLRVYLSYVSACCILFYCVLFGCTVRMCDCCEAVVSNFMVAIVFMAQSLSSGVVAILDCVMAIFYRIFIVLGACCYSQHDFNSPPVRSRLYSEKSGYRFDAR